MLNTATDRVSTLERWRRLLSESTEKGLPGSNAYAELAREIEQARIDALFVRAREDHGDVMGPREVVR